MKRPVLTLAMFALGCGAAVPAPPTTPAPTGRRVLVVRGETETRAGFAGIDAIHRVEAERFAPPDPTRHEAAVDRVRRAYRDLAFADAMTAAAEAMESIRVDVRDATDVEALHRLDVYRGMCELALGHPEAARAAFRGAASLRPDAPLPLEEFPPDVRALFDEEREALRAEPRVELSPDVSPDGATLALDGIVQGQAPATVSALPGAHYLRAEAPLHAPQTLVLELGSESEPPTIVLARLAGEQLVRALDPEEVTHLERALRGRVLRELSATSVLLAQREEEGWRGVSVEIDGTLRAAREAELPALVASLLPPRELPPESEPEEGESVWESPWLWGIAGAILAATGAAIAIGIVSQPTGHELFLSSSGR